MRRRLSGRWFQELPGRGLHQAEVDGSDVYGGMLPSWRGKSGEGGVPLTDPLRQAAPLPPSATPGSGIGRPQDVSPDLTQRYPWIYPPALAFAFVLTNVPQVVNPGVSVNLVQLAEVPRGQAGVVRAFGNACSDFTNIQWTFLIRGRPVQPITGLVLNYGAINAPQALPGPGVLLGPGDDLVVQATNVGVGIIAGVQARVDGYLWQE